MKRTTSGFVKHILKFAVVGLVLGLLAAACVTPGTVVESDSSYGYAAGATIPVDHGIYTITGAVAGDVDSLVRQTEPARGYVYGSSAGTFGSYYGAQFAGKGFVRLFVHTSNTELAPAETIVILKTTDTKAVMLLPGDIVTFKCRAQTEGIAAIVTNEQYNPELGGTQELDYCRLVTPVILVAPAAP